MSWHGPQFKGAAREARIRRREEAMERNARTLPSRRRAIRRAMAARVRELAP